MDKMYCKPYIKIQPIHYVDSLTASPTDLDDLASGSSLFGFDDNFFDFNNFNT